MSRVRISLKNWPPDVPEDQQAMPREVCKTCREAYPLTLLYFHKHQLVLKIPRNCRMCEYRRNETKRKARAARLLEQKHQDKAGPARTSKYLRDWPPKPTKRERSKPQRTCGKCLGIYPESKRYYSSSALKAKPLSYRALCRSCTYRERRRRIADKNIGEANVQGRPVKYNHLNWPPTWTYLSEVHGMAACMGLYPNPHLDEWQDDFTSMQNVLMDASSRAKTCYSEVRYFFDKWAPKKLYQGRERVWGTIERLLEREISQARWAAKVNATRKGKSLEKHLKQVEDATKKATLVHIAGETSRARIDPFLKPRKYLDCDCVLPLTEVFWPKSVLKNTQNTYRDGFVCRRCYNIRQRFGQDLVKHRRRNRFKPLSATTAWHIERQRRIDLVELLRGEGFLDGEPIVQQPDQAWYRALEERLENSGVGYWQAWLEEERDKVRDYRQQLRKLDAPPTPHPLFDADVDLEVRLRETQRRKDFVATALLEQVLPVADEHALLDLVDASDVTWVTMVVQSLANHRGSNWGAWAESEVDEVKRFRARLIALDVEVEPHPLFDD